MISQILEFKFTCIKLTARRVPTTWTPDIQYSLASTTPGFNKITFWKRTETIYIHAQLFTDRNIQMSSQVHIAGNYLSRSCSLENEQSVFRLSHAISPISGPLYGTLRRYRLCIVHATVALYLRKPACRLALAEWLCRQLHCKRLLCENQNKSPRYPFTHFLRDTAAMSFAVPALLYIPHLLQCSRSFPFYSCSASDLTRDLTI